MSLLFLDSFSCVRVFFLIFFLDFLRFPRVFIFQVFDVARKLFFFVYV